MYSIVQQQAKNTQLEKERIDLTHGLLHFVCCY